MKQQRFFSLAILGLLLILCPFSSAAQSSDEVNALLDVSARHFLPGQVIKVDVQLNNHTSRLIKSRTRLQVVNQGGLESWSTLLRIPLKANQSFRIPMMVKAPEVDGKYILRASADENGAKLSDDIPFDVFQPEKSKKLSKIMVYVPDYEPALKKFVEEWKINAPSFSWGQCMLCSYRTWQRLQNGDTDVRAEVERALRRNMSVIFLDFGPAKMPDIDQTEIDLPFRISTYFSGKANPEKAFSIVSKDQELNYHLQNMESGNWNGFDAVTVPPVRMNVKVKGGSKKNIVQAGKNPYRFPVVSISIGKGRGKVILSQLLTDGRLLKPDGKTPTKKDGLQYDPLTVQLVLNLISMSVDNSLLQGASN
ncbi:hypothetical protein PbJCM13498_37210 [Prolixibacter bellariivorans]|uniref:Uncharacterized protein n=1 Tax=Prolixibacter bellariivorans TaxID=314319 RepID=A0A5M4B4T2_9BACT|nr:hypothetical protein [Prolixibacter bellariivorans]GET34858.1 hypothetical protein PbJCM13498_37210 [Prolixibacter bellariivorans]